MMAVAWDIETCPLPTDTFSESHAQRHEKEVAKQQDRHPHLTPDEASRRARSFHPYLGWICCISVVRGEIGGSLNDPYSWTTGSPEDEGDMLETFWDDIAPIGGGTLWATFNGKDFDVPFLTARSAHHGITPSRDDIIDTYPYNHTPHADLSKVWMKVSSSLEEMCFHLGVASPKDGALKGSGVAEAVANGKLEQVRKYCERDVVATHKCLSALRWAF